MDRPNTASNRLRSVASLFISRDLDRRLPALDAFRGLMIIGMILVNHPPPTDAIFAPLVHAPWHSWTIADVIFPGFLFAVGYAVGIAIPGDPRITRSAGSGQLGKIARRFLLLLAVNFILVNFPYYVHARLYFHGTLSLIAWCYLAAALTKLHVPTSRVFWLAGSALLLQWAAYAWMPLPGLPSGTLLPDTNAATRTDQLILGHLPPPFGGAPTGPVLLPALGSVVSTLIGLIAAAEVQRRDSAAAKLAFLLTGGATLVAIGIVWNELLPINKKLWTGSYVVQMGGVAMLLLAALQWAAEPGRGLLRRPLLPLQVAGANALVFYVLAQALQRVLVFGRLRDDAGLTQNLRQWIYNNTILPWGDGKVGSLVFAGCFVAVGYAVVLPLYRRRIFFRL
jgi:predicted acyltransferase